MEPRARFHERNPSKLRLATVAVVGTAACFLATSVAVTLSLRWLPLPGSALMAERQVAALVQGRKYVPAYRWVGWDRIAPSAPLAVIAAEDQHFAEHRGFDVEAIQKAIDEHERGRRRRVRGASTISQQVAKNVFLWPGRSYVRKGLEVYFTLLIETLWPKRRILEVYLNVAEMGDGVFGVEAAGRRFFGKPASRLSAGEAAVLAAVLPNPHRFRANRPSAYVVDRRDWILRQMAQLGGEQYLRGAGLLRGR
jgi:monofunctional biosynthetic peptidoglycan transglycosylase